MAAPKGHQIPNRPKGRAPGSKNKSTTTAREAIAALVELNAPKMAEWLEEIRAHDGPLVAWRCVSDVMEYHLPKLARTELTTPPEGILVKRLNVTPDEADL